MDFTDICYFKFFFKDKFQIFKIYFGYFNFFLDKFQIFKTDHRYKMWNNDKRLLRLWQNGMTGYPIVDAAMRELNTTGFMHNRCRMIVAEFLTKDLLIDWKYGEQYFSKKLVDIDRIQNLGNWNWSSSFGLDASPYIRIFNPWSQSKKYDPHCEYIYKWLPELRNIKPSDIHTWYNKHDKYNIKYPKPIVDHTIQRKEFLKRFKKYVK